MRDSKSSGKKPIKEVHELRTRKPKLERVSSDITGRKKAEEELRQSEEFLANMIDALDDPVFVKDEQHRWVVLNDAACKVMGRCREELIGKSDYDLFSKQQADVFWERDDFVLKSGRTDMNEEEITWHGKLHTISTKKSLFIDSVTGKKFIVGTIRDIIERKKAAEALQDSEERYRAIFEQAADPIVLIDPKTTEIVEFNDMAHESLGHTREEFGKLKISDLEVVESLEEILKHAEKVITEGADNFETKKRTKSGEVRDYQVNAKAITLRGRDFIQSIWYDITERKEAEQALRESEERYRDIFNSTTDAILVLDLGNHIVDANPESCKMYGYSYEDMIGLYAQRLVHPDYRRRPENYKNEIENTGQAHMEAINLRKDGTPFNVEIRGTIFDHHGEKHFLVVVRDITERKQAEEMLSYERDLIRTLLENHPDFIYFKDNKAIFQHVSNCFCDFFGCSKEDIVGKTDLDLFPEEIARQTFNEDLHVIETGTPLINKEESASGTCVLTTKMPWFDKEGNTIGLFGISRDITERKKAEEEIRIFLSGIEGAYDGVAFTEMNGEVIYANEAAEKIFGYSPTEMTKLNVAAFSAHSEDAKHLEEAIAKQGKWRGEITGIRKNREKFPAILSVSVVKDEKGKPIGRMGIFRDITERKKAEEAIRQSERRFRTVVENSPDFIVLVQRDGIIFDVNHLAKGYTREMVIGQSVFNEDWYETKEQAVSARKQIEHVFRTGESGSFDYAQTAPEGSLSFYETRVAPFEQDTEGSILSVQCATRDITERKQVEQALGRSKTEWENTFNAISDWVVLMDLRGRILRTNRAGEEFVGVPLAGIVGQTCCKLLHGSDTPLPGCPLLKMIRTGRRETKELQLPDSNRWIAATVDPVVNENGTLVGAVHIASNITDRKRTEETLQKKTEELRVIFDSVPAGIWYKDTENRLLRVNKAGAESIGMKVEDVEGRAVCDIFPEDAEHYYEDDLEVIKSGKSKLGIVERMQAPGGEKKWVQTDKVPYRDEQGNVAGVIAFVQDITERKQAEEAYRALVDHSLQGLAIFQDGRAVFANQAMAEITGYTVDEILAMSSQQVQAFVHPEDRVLVWGRHRDRLKGKHPPDRYEFRGIRKDGTICWLEIHASRIEYQGKPAIQAAYVDITERKKAGEKLLEYQGQLKSLASQLTLAEERERHRIATELHDRIGQSLVISKMNLEALRKSTYGKGFDRTLDEICNSLGQTIADTRTLTFDLSSPILYQLGFETAVAEWLTEQIQDNHGIEAEFEDDGQPKPLDEDIRILLFRNVRELLINVVRHAWADKVRVSIRRVGNKIYVTVEDDGVGFDPAKAASTAAKRAEFGLFSIRQRLEDLGGHLEIKSKPGWGCKVTMTAPLKQE